MIKRFLLIFPLSFVLISCGHRISTSSLFYNKALEDSLETYISNIKEIENPYRAPTIMDIWINAVTDSLNKTTDTIVFISANYMISGPPGYADSADGLIVSSPYTLVGAGKICGKMCVVKYVDNHKFPLLVNEQLLTIPRKDFDFFYQYDGPRWDVRISRSNRLYKLNGKDSVVLLEREVGEFESISK